MGIERLTERQVVGEFYKALKADSGAGWINLVSNYFGSDQASEEYAWLGQSPVLRRVIGGRNAKGLVESNMTITNVHFESTIKILTKILRRDKSGQAFLRIRELARRSKTHWASLLSTLILNGASTDCYDDQYFFDTDHEEGDSGTQSNSITVDISALPVATAGTTALPSVAEFQFAIAQAIQAIVGFKDNVGEPMNEDASQFAVMVPHQYMNVAMQAVTTKAQVAETQSALEALQGEFGVKVVVNPRLTSWYSSYNFCVFRTDAEIKSFICQEETGVNLAVKGYGSEYEFDNFAHQYGIDTNRNVGYGYWQNSCLVTMS